ncbi:glutathione S-transferase C-terminal domain-containing protein [Pseudonocardia sp. MH-G8]|uniref:glutathione S-transferase C-terminal domain-containing protein n=1 Tax=Pseudonocardia sp. MH-G8 TaxID=1854588 RepID=UPI000B9FC52C|nr:glutathione S-transferase C-terminal domain-containing protein [Pseudonocardia sp. MH-G8]OZM76066.1 glutathione S-transferase [Pseudonocardia sp. MH-G8]
MITLYDDETSAQCYRVRATLGVLGLGFRAVAVQEYEVGPDEERPAVVLVDEQADPTAVVHDDTAALLYLARVHDREHGLLPDEPARLAAVLDWLVFARGLTTSAGAARRHESFGEPLDLPPAQQEAHRLLRVLDRHLWFGEQRGEDFLAGAFSLADIACFGDVALCEEGGVSRQDYPAVRRWCDRVKRVPGFPLMSGIFPAAAGRPA